MKRGHIARQPKDLKAGDRHALALSLEKWRPRRRIRKILSAIVGAVGHQVHVELRPLHFARRAHRNRNRDLARSARNEGARQCSGDGDRRARQLRAARFPRSRRFAQAADLRGNCAEIMRFGVADDGDEEPAPGLRRDADMDRLDQILENLGGG